MKYKDKIIKEIKEIRRGIIEATTARKIDDTATLTVKGISSLFRVWADIVIPQLIGVPDKFSFDALLEDEVMSPEQVEWRGKNEITLDDIKDMLLLASSEISSKYPNLQPLSEIKVKWLNEWFANEDEGSMTPPEPPKKPTNAKSKSRNQKNILDFILLEDDNEKQMLLDKLHTLIDGRKGRYVALVIRLCVERGIMRRPTFRVLSETFDHIGNRTNYSKYYNKKLSFFEYYYKDEINGIDTHIKP